ncbi:MAG TPA: AAA family ATPase [Solirubrobacteraceae bacterium]|nr:AAA family ATPase [Solirubrobacteraceae bacterium]
MRPTPAGPPAAIADATGGTEVLLEREAEVDDLRALVARVAGGAGGLVVVEGQAGVGKTELLRSVSALAEDAGMRVLRGRGAELDRAFAFGVVRQLLEREVTQTPDLLTGGAEPASAVFATGDGEPRAEDGLYGSLQGLLWLVANLSAQQPLLLVADDLHWADTASLRWLVFLAERLEDVPVLLVAATRPAEPGADQELLDALMTAQTARVLRPAPLSEAATTAIVRDRLPEAVESFATACHRATGGNPFLLGVLIDELAGGHVRGTTNDASRVLGFGSERVGLTVRRRLRRLPPEAVAIARAVAVLGPSAPLDQAAVLAGVGEDRAAASADALVGIHVLAAGQGLDFVHPLVRSAIYEQIPPLERQALHAGAARLLSAQGAESESVARHLLCLPPAGEQERVTVLRSAARHASASGAAGAAAHYLRRALEEPPDEHDRGSVLHDLGVAEATDRQRDAFERHLREAMAATVEVRERGEIALELGRALAAIGDFRASVDVLDRALRDIGTPDDQLGAALEAELLAMATHDFTSPGVATERWERRFAQLEAEEAVHPWIEACLVHALATSRGPAAEAIRLAERVLAADPLDEGNSVVAGMLGNGLIYAGAPTRGGRFYDERIATATRRGSRITVAWQSVMRSDASLRLGEIRRAETEARQGLEVFMEGSGEAGVAWSIAHLMHALLARGAVDEADALDSGHSMQPSAPRSLPLALLLAARANLHLERARPGEALSAALAAGELVSPTIGNPAVCGWRTPAALALAALGRRDEAGAMAQAELDGARRFGVPDAIGVALRTSGRIAGGREGIELLREAVATHAGTDGGLERARAKLELGSALRRAGERTEAREVLRAALDATARVGARGLADRAHEELVAAGARPRRDRRMLTGRESLTSGEDRVAALAAQGLSNREIAQRHVVTVKAVQWHLRNVYRKLDVSSRDELPAALGLEPALRPAA